MIVRVLWFVTKEVELSTVIAADADEADANRATKRRARSLIRHRDAKGRDDSVIVGLSAGRPAVFLMDPLFSPFYTHDPDGARVHIESIKRDF